MGTRISYKTKHRDQILDVLHESGQEHMTAGQIHERLRARGISIGAATVYRQLDKLVEEGAVNKYMVDAVTGACYEFKGEQGAESAYVHGKCEKCGKVVHLGRKSLEAVMRTLSDSENGSGFELDCSRTLFYGICRDCRRQE
ncbi:MAG TPA: Fe2+/Zn2+ uptake regulation protein [Lachnospiraceae bacterium]|nr:Fe2+/Zn2+ uptake regulation protein [Lachnospiraceae bacterium]